MAIRFPLKSVFVKLSKFVSKYNDDPSVSTPVQVDPPGTVID